MPRAWSKWTAEIGGRWRRAGAAPGSSNPTGVGRLTRRRPGLTPIGLILGSGRGPFGLLILFLLLLPTLTRTSGGLVAGANAIPSFHPPAGPYVNLGPADFEGVPGFTATNRLVLTPYFYWYDVFSGAHLFNPDGSDALTDHPASLTGFSYRSVAWHRRQLLDMREAGIDIVLPVYWGEPSQRRPGRPLAEQPWSYAGLPPLVEARDTLLQAGESPPRIGLFYDTSTLQFNEAGERIDLTTDRGRQWFYETIRDFFSLIPPRHWAMIDGRPVVFLYSAAFALRHDSSCVEFLRESFRRDFGGRTPFLVREISWNITADQTYAWGGALGLRNPGVASLGPGYDHSAVPGREPLVVPREGGAFFERNWLALLRRPATLVMIETWNEFHEGTDIADSREYGRTYIELNRRYADLFKAGYQPPGPPSPFAGARLVSVDLGITNREAGLVQFESADGLTAPAIVEGSSCRVTVSQAHGGYYVYLKIDDAFKTPGTMEVTAVVEFFDATRGTLRLEYDGSDAAAPFQGAYTPTERVALSGSRTWRRSVFPLRAARFLNSQNGGADLRVNAGQPGIGIRSVQIFRPGLTAVRFDPVEGFELAVYAAPGLACEIEASSDLQAWQPLVRLMPQAVRSRYLAPPAPPPPWRWYRLRPTAP